MKVLYVADDGTEFETARDCTEYEEEQKVRKLTREFLMFDKQFKAVDCLEDAYYLYLTDTESKEAYEDYCNVFGYDCDNSTDGEIEIHKIYKYDDDMDVWVNLDMLIEQLCIEWDNIMTLVEKHV